MANAINVNALLTAINNGVTEYKAVSRNFKRLPKAKDARLVPCTNSGKYDKGNGRYTVKGWNIEVDVKINGKIVTHDWNVWLVAAGMKCSKSRFTDLAKAKEMKKEILKNWGKCGTSERKPETSKMEAVKRLAKRLNKPESEILAALAA